MDSDIACRPGPGEPSSPLVDARAVSVSQCEYLPLRRSSDFRRVLSSGRRVRRGGVTVAMSPNSADVIRIGLVVGKAVGNAVQRNRAKRRLRHALAATPLEQGMDYVIIADRQVVDTPFTTLSGWLLRATGGPTS